MESVSQRPAGRDRVDKEIFLVRVKKMSKVSSKLQVSLPKALADEFGIRPGDEIEWQSAGDVIRVVPGGRRATQSSTDERLALFDEATRRQRQREKAGAQSGAARSRGWTRDELYDRGRSR